MVCSLCLQKGHNKRTCINIINCRINENIETNTYYNIYIICINKDIFNEKIKLFNNYKNINFIFIKATYLEKNNILLKKLKTRYNTSDDKIISKLGCISSHRKCLLDIINKESINNIILEEDFIINNKLPEPPNISCYFGGWIIPSKISLINKKKIKIELSNGINDINYDIFSIIMTHSYYIKNSEDANKILISTLLPDKIKNYDIHLKDNKLLKQFYYPPIFIQSNHKSTIDNNGNNNSRSINYGL